MDDLGKGGFSVMLAHRVDKRDRTWPRPRDRLPFRSDGVTELNGECDGRSGDKGVVGEVGEVSLETAFLKGVHVS